MKALALSLALIGAPALADQLPLAYTGTGGLKGSFSFDWATYLAPTGTPFTSSLHDPTQAITGKFGDWLFVGEFTLRAFDQLSPSALPDTWTVTSGLLTSWMGTGPAPTGIEITVVSDWSTRATRFPPAGEMSYTLMFNDGSQVAGEILTIYMPVPEPAAWVLTLAGALTALGITARWPLVHIRARRTPAIPSLAA